MATLRLITVLALALVAACIAAVGASALGEPEDLRVAVIAPLATAEDGFSDGGDAPEGLVAVLALPADDGSSEGGDRAIPVFVEPDGFSDGGDLPEGFVRGLAPPAPDGFSDGGDGMIAVLALRADGSGELVAVTLPLAQDSPLPPEGGGS